MTDLPADVEIEYVDSKGQQTRRPVTVMSVREKEGRRYLNAWCHASDRFRSFRADRVTAVITGDGEVLDPAPVIDPWFALDSETAPSDRRAATQLARPSGKRRSLSRLLFPAAMLALAAFSIAVGATADTAFDAIGIALTAFAMTAVPLWVVRAILRAVLRFARKH